MQVASYDQWKAKARAVPIEREIERRGIKLQGEVERVGPCPKCGGEDRFSINTEKNLWNCSGCDKGGDVIDLVQHLDGVDFETACATLAGELALKRNGKNPTSIEARKVVVSEFQYLDEDGALAFVVERIEYQNADGSCVLTTDGKRRKTFRQKRPDPNRPAGWLWNVDGVPPIPYRLPELIKSVASGSAVLVVEGEAKVDLLRSWNIPATSCAGGAKKWRAEHAAYLKGAHVVILPDNDGIGREHVDVVGRGLQDVARSIRVLALPDLPPKGDIIDWAESGGTVEQLHDLIESAAAWLPPAEGSADEAAEATICSGLDGDDAKESDENESCRDPGYRKSSQTEILLRVAASATLFHTPQGDAFADVKINGHRETWSIRSKGFRGWLGRGYFELTGGAASSDALQSALNILEAKAHF
jgi:CHC2 zinc finger